MQAVILAGGKGTRLKPFTYVFPKPLVPVGEKPILAFILEQLKKSGFSEIVMCVNHLKELIMAYFGRGENFGLNISYSFEKEPLGTIAPLRLIKELEDDFLVLNGDLLTDLDIGAFYRFHLQHRSLATVATFERVVKIDFGVVENRNNFLTAFREKPEHRYEVSMGIYAFNKKILDFIPPRGRYGFDDLMLGLLEKKERVLLYPHSGYWLDIGRPEDFEKANDDIDRVCP